jgi:hypothetical protein
MALIYLDECGFTGEDLFNSDQPVFVLASTILTEEVCKEILSVHFSKVQAKELKHSSLAKRPRQQDMVLSFLKDVDANFQGTVKFSVAHKRYVLVTKIVDFLIETLAYEDGINLYKDGANIAYSNMLFYIVRSLVSESYFNEMIFSFQEMMRNRTIESYERFFKPLFEKEFPQVVDELLVLLKAFHMRLGYGFIKSIPENSLDIAFTDALILMNEWKDAIASDDNIILIHDSSSNMAKEKRFWDVLVHPQMAPKVVGFDRRKMSYPLRVEQTRFESSKNHAGLQFVDILAGAIARSFKWVVEGKIDTDTYGKNLSLNMPKSFGGHLIWPSPEVTPDELGTTGEDADDPIDHITKIRTEFIKQGKQG